jgi:1,3-beta-glucan synthase
MSGHPHGGHYDDGYGHQEGNTDSYNAGYGEQHLDQHHGHAQGADGYYDES